MRARAWQQRPHASQLRKIEIKKHMQTPTVNKKICFYPAFLLTSWMGPP